MTMQISYKQYLSQIVEFLLIEPRRNGKIMYVWPIDYEHYTLWGAGLEVEPRLEV